MTFQPGAKVPDGVAVAATPAAADKAAEKPASTPAVVPKEPAEIAHAFFTLLGKSDIDAAYAGLTRGSKIAERPEELRALKTKTQQAIEVFGAVRGYDLVENKPVGLDEATFRETLIAEGVIPAPGWRRLVRATYISLGKDFPLRWRFYFYKAEDVWSLIDLRVDDKLTGIFDEPEEAKTAERQ